MKSAIAFIGLGLLATVQAQSECLVKAAGLPTCALSASSGCAPTDLQCACANAAKSQAEGAACVLKACSSADAVKAQSVATDVCACVQASSPSSSTAPETSAAPASAAPEISAAPASAAPVSTPSSEVPSASEASTSTSSPSAAGTGTSGQAVQQIGDGQVQTGGKAVQQIGDGQIQAGNGSVVSNSTMPMQFTGAAAKASSLSAAATFAVVFGAVLAAY